MQPWGIELISIRAQNDMITACLFFSIFLRTDHLDSLPVWGVTDPTWPWCVLRREGSCDSRCGHAPKADQSSRTLKVSCCTWADWQEVGRLPPQSSTPERKIDTFPLRLSSGVEKEKNNTNFKKKKKNHLSSFSAPAWQTYKKFLWFFCVVSTLLLHPKPLFAILLVMLIPVLSPASSVVLHKHDLKPSMYMNAHNTHINVFKMPLTDILVNHTGQQGMGRCLWDAPKQAVISEAAYSIPRSVSSVTDGSFYKAHKGRLRAGKRAGFYGGEIITAHCRFTSYSGTV